jgi:hypothetical protein
MKMSDEGQKFFVCGSGLSGLMMQCLPGGQAAIRASRAGGDHAAGGERSLASHLSGQQKALQLRRQHPPSFSDLFRLDLAGGNQFEKCGPRDAQILAGFAGIKDFRLVIQWGAAAATVRVDPAVGDPTSF